MRPPKQDPVERVVAQKSHEEFEQIGVNRRDAEEEVNQRQDCEHERREG